MSGNTSFVCQPDVGLSPVGLLPLPMEPSSLTQMSGNQGTVSVSGLGQLIPELLDCWPHGGNRMLALL